MPIVWSDGLSVGIKQLDSQTREMIGCINGLQDAMSGEKGAADVEKVLKFLEAHACAHFGAQEELMNKHAYPAQKTHISEHEYFRKEIARLRKMYDQGVDVNLLFNSTRRLCITWFTQHVNNVDRSLGRYIRTRGISELGDI